LNFCLKYAKIANFMRKRIPIFLREVPVKHIPFWLAKYNTSCEVYIINRRECKSLVRKYNYPVPRSAKRYSEKVKKKVAAKEKFRSRKQDNGICTKRAATIE
jgi:hypothetical protein